MTPRQITPDPGFPEVPVPQVIYAGMFDTFRDLYQGQIEIRRREREAERRAEEVRRLEEERVARELEIDIQKKGPLNKGKEKFMPVSIF